LIRSQTVFVNGYTFVSILLFSKQIMIMMGIQVIPHSRQLLIVNYTNVLTLECYHRHKQIFIQAEATSLSQFAKQW